MKDLLNLVFLVVFLSLLLVAWFISTQGDRQSVSIETSTVAETILSNEDKKQIEQIVSWFGKKVSNKESDLLGGLNGHLYEETKKAIDEYVNSLSDDDKPSNYEVTMLEHPEEAEGYFQVGVFFN